MCIKLTAEEEPKLYSDMFLDLLCTIDNNSETYAGCSHDYVVGMNGMARAQTWNVENFMAFSGAATRTIGKYGERESPGMDANQFDVYWNNENIAYSILEAQDSLIKELRSGESILGTKQRLTHLRHWME